MPGSLVAQGFWSYIALTKIRATVGHDQEEEASTIEQPERTGARQRIT
jgi:hypothetical protein